MKIEKEKIVVYLGPFSFPNGGAAARRILGISQALLASGFAVKIASGQLAQKAMPFPDSERIEVVSLGERTAEHLPRLLKHLTYFSMGAKTIAWLDSLARKPDVIILYSGYSPYLLKLIPWAKRNNVKLVFDAVEWYDPESFLHWLSPYQLNIEFSMRMLLPKVGNIIAISSYLDKYYRGKSCRSIVIPPTIDAMNTCFSETGRDAGRPLQLVYAGSPAKKDLLDNILEAVLQLRAAGYDLRLAVAGIHAAQARNYRSVKTRTAEEVGAGVDFKGMLSHAESIDLVRSADFSLLLRHEARYSRAGFPTKFVESMTVGTPVIANVTSDLGSYLIDEVTGFSCPGPSPEDLRAGLLKAINLPQEEHVSMRKNCRNTALRCFDFRVFSSSLSDFMNSAQV